jgi:hypothetical protein
MKEKRFSIATSRSASQRMRRGERIRKSLMFRCLVQPD